MDLYFFFIVPVVYVLINFLYYQISGKVFKLKFVWTIVRLYTVVVAPIGFLKLADVGQVNDCCSDSAVFSPGHSMQIYILIGIAMLAYVVSIFRRAIFPPILELLLQSLLILGFIINVLLCFHLNTGELGPIWWIVGNVPILMLYLISISENHKLLREYIKTKDLYSAGALGKLAALILRLDAIYRYPILTICLIPITGFLSLFLLLFGQKPDSLIRAFTDTYKHGFSQLDYLCDNVQCGGHFLCSVGANGHKSIVQPVRYGERNGEKIICNRQLLIANAFEELIQENMPKLHRFIRGKYNKVGNVIHKYYDFFAIKLVSDTVYVMMKPLEFVFLMVLYTCDANPENRINSQYLSQENRIILKSKRDEQ